MVYLSTALVDVSAAELFVPVFAVGWTFVRRPGGGGGGGGDTV